MPARLFAALLLWVAEPPSTISIDFDHPLRTFDPHRALGAGIDGHERGDTARMLRAGNIARMRSAGLHELTYRLRTELAGEAWHWNPRGTWSDRLNSQGYWTSDSEPADAIEVSYGYRLPRRGNTIDQANNDSYSRITDGDSTTFWKSNPYLNSLPQWVILDFGTPQAIDTVRIHWGIPQATAYTVQFGDNKGWHELPPATGTNAVQTRSIRVWMTESSGTAPPGSTDARDRTGYAIREIEAGLTDWRGNFHDAVRHSRKQGRQTVVTVSSTDPWHRAADRDENIEQPGLDFVFRSGLTNGQPALIAAPILYDTPENAAAEIIYLKSRRYPVDAIELGEEPEEQEIPPEQYGALYRKWFATLRAVDPEVRLGGPSLVLLAPEAEPEPSWTKRWITDMRDHSALEQVQFFSFEWYPFDDVCEPVAPHLTSHAALFQRAMNRLVQDGVPESIPWFLTEYGYSAYGAEAEVTLPGAILNAEIAATFLSRPGSKAFLYGYEPNDLLHEKSCSWGNNMLFLDPEALQPMPTYYAARMLAQDWAQASGGQHTLYATSINHPGVTGFTLKRPDGKISILLLNKNPDTTANIEIPLPTVLEAVQYSPAQYVWRSAGSRGHPTKNLPPAKLTIVKRQVSLPPYSITVVKER